MRVGSLFLIALLSLISLTYASVYDRFWIFHNLYLSQECSGETLLANAYAVDECIAVEGGGSIMYKYNSTDPNSFTLSQCDANCGICSTPTTKGLETCGIDFTQFSFTYSLSFGLPEYTRYRLMAEFHAPNTNCTSIKQIQITDTTTEMCEVTNPPVRCYPVYSYADRKIVCGNSEIPPTVSPTISPTLSPTDSPTNSPTNSPTYPPANCNDHGIVINNMCQCYSGHSGTTIPAFDCAYPAPPSCPRLTATPTTTVGSPMINNSYVMNNIVHIKVQSPIVVGRTISQFIIGSCPVIFSKLNNWDNCEDTFLGEFPLSNISNCNISRSEDERYIYYELPVAVINTEELDVGGLNVTRTITDTLTVQVRLPRTVDTGNTIYVNSTVAILAVINDQSYLTSTNKVQIRLSTYSPYPFYLDQPTASITPPGLGLDSFAEITPNGVCSTFSTCVQTFSLTLSPSVCTMTGRYVLDFALLARSLPGSSTAQVILDLTSSDFCSVVEAPITLSTQLNVYRDQAHSEAKNNFATNEYGYFVVQASSSQVTAIREEILKITVSSPTFSATLYNNGTTTVHGSRANINVDGSSFSIQFVSSVFVLFPGQYDTYDINVKIGVTYEGLQRRSVREVSIKTITSEAGSQLVLEGATDNPTLDGESTASACCIGFLFLVTLFVLLF